jgi:hypothetical protein
MGTALGDLFATTFHLGYLASALVFAALICVPLIAWRLGANPVLTFWVAYILTRPIGASFADFFGMPKDVSGMGYGHAAVSAVTLVLVVASFIYLSRTGIDQPEAASSAQPTAPAGYGQPEYAQPPHSGPQYHGHPRRGQPQYEQRPYEHPPYADPGQDDPRYSADPRYGNPRYRDQQDYR